MASWEVALLPLLLLWGPAQGNEGAAAGACGCHGLSSEMPPKLKKYARRMSTWEPCMDYIKFKFPQGDIFCGFKSRDWVQQLMNDYPEKEKGLVVPDRSHGPPKPALPSAPQPSTSTSRDLLSTQPPTVSLRVILQKTLAMHPAAEVPKDSTPPPALTRSLAPPSQDPLAASPASQAPHVAESGGSRTVVFSLLAVTLVAVAVATVAVCRRGRRQRLTLVPHRNPAEEQIHLPHHEET